MASFPYFNGTGSIFVVIVSVTVYVCSVEFSLDAALQTLSSPGCGTLSAPGGFSMATDLQRID